MNRRPADKIRLIYILAASHSGSTLLAMLLNAHNDIASVGELKATSLGDVSHYKCSCQRLVRECDFWTGISQDMSEYGIPFDIVDPGTHYGSGVSSYVRRLQRPLHRGAFFEKLRDVALSLSVSWQARLPEIQNRNEALMRCILKRSEKKLIVDSSKIGLRLKFLLRHPQLDVKVVRLIRDGRAVALAYMDPFRFADASDPGSRGGGAGGNRDAERLPMSEAALEWRRSNEEAVAILNTMDKTRYIEVRYEDLCRQTTSTLDSIFSFVGVDKSLWNREFRSVQHHIIGNGMRLDSAGEINLDERWRSRLPPSDLKIFESRAGKMNRNLGHN